MGRVLSRILAFAGVGAGRGILTSTKGFLKKSASRVKTITGAGFLAALPSLIGDRNKDQEATDEATDDAIKQANIQRPEITSSSIKSDDSSKKALLATAQFSKYVEDMTQDVRPIRAIGKQLPEITVSRKYSPIMTEIIENVNNLKKRLQAVEKKTHLQTSLLMKLKSASMVMSNKVQEAIEENEDRELEQKREEDEREIELKGISRFDKLKDFAYDNVFQKTKDYATGVKDMLVTALKTFAVPTGLLTLGLISDLAEADDGEEGDLTPMQTAGAGLLGFGAAARRTIRSIGRQSSRLSDQPKGSLERNNVAKHHRKTRKMKSILGRLKKLPYIGTFAGIASSYLVFNSIDAIFMRLSTGELSEEEAEQRIKEQLARLVTDLGGAFLGAYIGGLLGGKVGGTAGMILGPKGAAIAGLAGLGIGSYVGYKAGVEFMRRSGAVEMVVNALYDYILGSDSALMRVWEEMTKMTKYSDEELIRQGYSPDMTPAQMIARSTQARTITDEEGNVRAIRTAQTIFDVDERGIVTALSRVKSPQEYYQVKSEVESGLEDRTFEDFLSDVLNKEEMSIVVDSMASSMYSNENVSDEEVNKFLQDISTNSEVFRATMPDLYQMVEKGEAIPIILPDGTRTVATLEDIRQSMIPEAQKLRLIETAEEQMSRQAELFKFQSGIQGRDVDISEEMFMNAPDLRTTPTNPQASIVPVVMSNPTISQKSGSLNMSKPSMANPNPSSVTSDSFLNVGFTT